MSSRKRKNVEDMLASPQQPGTVSDYAASLSDNNDQQQRPPPRQRQRQPARAHRRSITSIPKNNEYRLWRVVNRERKLKELNIATEQVVSGWTCDSTQGGPPAGYSADCAEYLRAAGEIEDRYGGKAGELVTFGNNDSVQLGFPDFLDEEIKKTVYPPRVVQNVAATGGKIRQLACGGLHNLVLTEDGYVLTWGVNDDGALGRETDAITEATPMVVKGFVSQQGMQEDGQIVAISAGDSHCLFLTQSGNVYQCGLYKDSDSGKFHDIAHAGADPYGKNTKPVPVWQLAKNVMQIYSGGGFNVAMLSDHSIVTWGFGCCGELARSADMIVRNADGEFDLMKPHKNEQTGEFDLDFVRDKFLKPGPVRFASGSPKKTVLTVACGFSHLLVVAREPNKFRCTLYTSGNNQYGQLGHGDTEQRHELTAVTAFKNMNVGKVAAGQFHSMCLNLIGSELYSWGREDYSQLGQGEIDKTTGGAGKFKSVPVLVKFPAIEGPEVRLFSEIACGDSHSMALTTDHELYTWGYEGTTGQRGYNNKDLSVPTVLPLAERIRGKHQTGPDTHVLAYKMDGGGQHSAVLVKRYAKAADDNNNEKDKK